MKIHIFTFNPFSENTYIISGEDKTCTIIDPGCYDQSEFDTLQEYIQVNEFKPTKVVQTHAHLDHIFGLKRCLDTFDVPYFMHDLEKTVLDSAAMVSGMYGVRCDVGDALHETIQIGEDITMGGVTWKTYFTPGHSPGSVCYHNEETQQVIAGDVLFRDSIGRTDLPGGDHETLLTSIREQLYVLHDETVVYPGHGPSTTIGYEKRNNPFVRSEMM